METLSIAENRTNVIRVDKNLGFNSLNWVEVYEKDAALCFDIILYLSNNSQRDIFNYGTIDLNHFCKTMGYQKTNLQKVAETPAQKELENKNLTDTLERSKKFITVFENALYKLGRYTIPFESLTLDREKNEHVYKTNFIQIIKEMNIHIVNPNKAFSKIYYTYTTSEEFDFNLCRYFFFTDLNMVKELREKNLLLLYFYLKNIENGHHTQFIERDFAKLCSFAGVKVNYDNIKYTKKNLQTRKLEVLRKYVEFEYKAVRISGNWKYGYAFTFNANKEYKKEDDLHVIRKSAADYINVKLLQFYKKRYKVSEVDTKTYNAWFFDKEKDGPEKAEIFFAAMAKLYQTTKQAATNKFASWHRQFFTKKTTV